MEVSSDQGLRDSLAGVARRFEASPVFLRFPITVLSEYAGLMLPDFHGFSPMREEEAIEVRSIALRNDSVTNYREIANRIVPGREGELPVAEGTLPQVNSSSRGSRSAAGESSVSDSAENSGINLRSSSSSYFSPSLQLHDVQNYARSAKRMVPFSLLLILVFIRQHIQGFCVVLWLTAILYKSNDVIRKQTTLKSERRISLLLAIMFELLLHNIVIYWIYAEDGLISSLILLPPKSASPFWHAVFIIAVNDTMVRLQGMAMKCVVLLFLNSSRGHKFQKQVILLTKSLANLLKWLILQGRMLALIEYATLLYRALLPTPVWYRFFLNKQHGSCFSSLTTGVYLTISLASIFRKIQMLLTAYRALTPEMRDTSYPTAKQVNEEGRHCAICQRRMQIPMLLRCKHMFCEECATEWSERGRTCPLCRTTAAPANFKPFSDGSTSLLIQIF